MSNELRWNPVLGEWIIVASKREKRPWRPEKCPFCPGSDETVYGWDVQVLPNRFPALKKNPKTRVKGSDIYKVRPGYGYCEIVVETPVHTGDLCDIPIDNLKKVIDVFSDRYIVLGLDERIKYVYEFRNKGKVIGVSLHHPHSQIYALPFIPPKIKRELREAKRFWKNRGKCLFCHIVSIEKRERIRIVYENKHFILFIPFFAMWPYEMHIYSKKHVQSIDMFNGEERYYLADILKIATKTYNLLFDFSLPYIMAIHQKPTDGKKYEYYHFHIEFYPPHRDKDKLKYPAGIERGTGTFTYDGLPEERAKYLKEACRRALKFFDKNGYKYMGKAG